VYTVVLVFFVIVLNFVIFEAMPGYSGSLYTVLANPRLSTEQRNAQIALYGLSGDPWSRFLTYVRNLLTFQFGISYKDNLPVSELIVTSGRLENTLLLLGTSTVLSIVIGTLLGILVSKRRGSSMDNLLVTSSLTTFSLPTFFMGILLIFAFALTFRWFPVGNVTPTLWGQTNNPVLPPLWLQLLIRAQHLFLPALTLTLFSYGGFLLLTRATMMETLNEDYILTARAKGLSGRVILFHHAFKNASLPLITASALSFGGILGGAIITETVFNWDGLGQWLYTAVLYKDFPVMQAMFYIIALCVIAANLISDILYGIADPRVKYE
jgi:peptide/nickel transport system permease protein